MSDIEIAKITAHIEGIRTDINELKDGYKEIARAITRLAVIEDRFKANDESHRILWDKLNKTSDKFSGFESIADTVKDWKHNINKLWVAVGSLVIVEAVRVIFTFGLKK